MARTSSIISGKPDLYGEVTARIIADLEAGTVPWVQPWADASAPLDLPANAASGRRYSGINILLLWIAALDRGFATQRWLTFRQALAAGGAVRRGERGTTIFYAAQFTPGDDKAEGGDETDARAVRFLKRFTVFNVDQCDGLAEQCEATREHLPEEVIVEDAEAVIEASGVAWRISGTHEAFYSPSLDLIMVPPRDAFALKPLSERLVGELTAHRTLALRNAVACLPQVALTLLLHRLVVDAFLHGSAGGACLDASVRHVFFPVQGPELKDSLSAAAIQARQAGWKERVPADEASVWDWLVALADDDRLALLAHCVSFGVNALAEKVDRYGGSGITQSTLARRFGQADRLAEAVDLDMVAAGWRPTFETYLSKVTKPRILEAVREARGEQAAQLIDHLKKGDMAHEAERLLEGSGWLPEPLRAPIPDAATTTPVAEVEEGSPLPDFLAEAASGADEAGSAASDGEGEESPEVAIAAE